MAISLEYHERPHFFGGRGVEARVYIGVLGVSGYGDTREQARKDLLHRVRLHQTAVSGAIEAIEGGTDRCPLCNARANAESEMFCSRQNCPLPLRHR